MAWLDALKGAILTEDPNAPRDQAPTMTVKAGNISTVPVQMAAPVDSAAVAAIKAASKKK